MEKRILTNVCDFLKEVKKGAYLNVSAISEPKFSKKSGFAGYVKCTIYKSCILGADYATQVENAAKRSGESVTSDYKVSTNTGKGTWINGLYGLVTENEKGVRYLHVYLKKCTKKVVTYISPEGEEFTQDNPLFEAIYMADPASKKSKSACPKQAAFGVSDEQAIFVITPKLDNVIRIEQGNLTYYKYL